MARLHRRPAGGWVHAGEPFRMQREDKGQDFEILLHHDIIAPGWGKCVAWLQDGPFPNGFGSPYGIFWFGSGRFKHETWYAGHANRVYIKPGQWFHTGQRLARLDNSLNRGWGWVEIGRAPGGRPGDIGHYSRRELFKPAWVWA